MKISKTNLKSGRPHRSGQAGMTLVEVVMSMLITAVAVGCMITGYIFSVTSAEKSGMSFAATARAQERLEQTRCAQWDVASYPIKDQLLATNFPDTIVTLDISGSGTNATYATNITTIYEVSKDPPLKGIRVDCVWTFQGQLISNTVETVRSPD
ncbi:MAG TPA: prepilin-type N-terminal cleavage/methylation domain-containing protein [Candidatus Limnocylindria bacterium]|nr:prepilin-type N-terminal cleavage/methylation domain-containing protein [Candidatus Limnocylindria bacterium]